jgi:ligand-binding sensor domain-containing protein
MVRAIHQDRQGFMWFGTKDGLNRYDGYQFTVFRNDPFDSTSISSNFIQAIFEDRHGRLWISTDNGLNVYDPRTEKFRRFKHDSQDSLSLSGNSVREICETPEWLLPPGVRSVLWIATTTEGLNQLVVLDESERQNPPRAAHDSITSGARDGNDSLFSVLRRDHYFIRHRHNPADPASLISDEVRDVLIDRRGTLWIATRGGLDWLDLKSHWRGNQLLAARTDFGHKLMHGDKARISFSGLHSLLEDRDGLLYVGTDRSLIRMYSNCAK